MEATNTTLAAVILPFASEIVRKNAMGVEVLFKDVVDDMLKGTKNNRSEAYKKFYDEKNNVWTVSKETRYINVTLGREYTNSVENRSDNEENYEVEKPKGKSWLEYPYLLKSDRDETKLFLRVFENANTKRKTTYFVNGREATPDEVAIIKAHLPKKNYDCKKQLDYGVAEDKQVTLKDLTLSKIAYIKFGDKKLQLAQTKTKRNES